MKKARAQPEAPKPEWKTPSIEERDCLLDKKQFSLRDVTVAVEAAVKAAQEDHQEEMRELLINDHVAAFLTHVAHLPQHGVMRITFANARSIALALIEKAGYGK